MQLGGNCPGVDLYNLPAHKQRQVIKELGQEIVGLRKEYGIYGNVRPRLGPRIAAHASIEEHDPASVVSDKLHRLFSRIVAGLTNEKLRAIATVELNLSNEGTKLVERRVAHRKREGPCERSSDDRMQKEVAPDLVRLILSDPTRFGTA